MCQFGGDGTKHQNPYKTQAEIDWSPREKVLTPLVGPSRPTSILRRLPSATAKECKIGLLTCQRPFLNGEFSQKLLFSLVNSQGEELAFF